MVEPRCVSRDSTKQTQQRHKRNQTNQPHKHTHTHIHSKHNVYQRQHSAYGATKARVEVDLHHGLEEDLKLAPAELQGATNTEPPSSTSEQNGNSRLRSQQKLTWGQQLLITTGRMTTMHTTSNDEERNPRRENSNQPSISMLR